MNTTYDLNKIKFATDEATFKSAVDLYECGRVTEANIEKTEKLSAMLRVLFWTKVIRQEVKQ